MDIYYSASQPRYTDLSFSPTSGFAQPDEGLTPASGHYLQRNMQVTQTGSNEVKARIPNLVQDSDQVRFDGTLTQGLLQAQMRKPFLALIFPAYLRGFLRT